MVLLLGPAQAAASLSPGKGVLKSHSWFGGGSIFVHLQVFSFLRIVVCDPCSVLQAMSCSTQLEMDVGHGPESCYELLLLDPSTVGA